MVLEQMKTYLQIITIIGYNFCFSEITFVSVLLVRQLSELFSCIHQPIELGSFFASRDMHIFFCFLEFCIATTEFGFQINLRTCSTLTPNVFIYLYRGSLLSTNSLSTIPEVVRFINTGGPRIVRILGHQGIVLLQKSY